jgi:hypothetical protein
LPTDITRTRRTGGWPLRVAVCLLLGNTAAAAAQDPRLTARLPTGTALAIEQLVDSAVALGLPADPLVLKALEGQSKGADSARIVSATRLLLTRLITSRQQLGTQATMAELVAGAAALKAGALPASLNSLRVLRHERPLVVPLSVLADLLTVGIPAAEAWRSVEQMASSGASDAQFIALRDRLTGSADPGQRLPPSPERPPVPRPDAASSRP